ncbi:MAG: FkbM family methyltransferase [Rhodospirillales bacterium]|nr:FkbM family methyltransferase [Rhodospirillales bacterium]
MRSLFSSNRINKFLINRALINRTVLDGVSIDLTDKQITKEIRRHIAKGTYEIEERSLLKKYLQPADRVLELGAGMGLVTAVCAKNAAKTISIEANPSLIELVQSNLDFNGLSATVIHGIASTKDGVSDFHVAPQFWSSSTIDRGNSKKISIPSIDVNRIIRENDVNVLVLDIEGGEDELLRNSDLSKIEKICVEIHPGVLGTISASELVGYIIAQGYTLDFNKFDQVFFFSRPTVA